MIEMYQVLHKKCLNEIHQSKQDASPYSNSSYTCYCKKVWVWTAKKEHDKKTERGRREFTKNVAYMILDEINHVNPKTQGWEHLMRVISRIFASWKSSQKLKGHTNSADSAPSNTRKILTGWSMLIYFASGPPLKQHIKEPHIRKWW